MPTNEQRRANAKRKLQRQLERRAQQSRRRRTLAIVGGSAAAAVVVAAIVVTVVLTNQDHNNKQASASGSSSTTATPGRVSGAPLPRARRTTTLRQVMSGSFATSAIRSSHAATVCLGETRLNVTMAGPGSGGAQ